MGSFFDIFEKDYKWGHFARFLKKPTNEVILRDFAKSLQMGSFCEIFEKAYKWGHFARFCKKPINRVILRDF